MHLIFRTFLLWMRGRRRTGPLLGVHDVGSIRFRVLPTDLDVLGHMNNGVYLSIMDLGRMDLMQRSGVWKTLLGAGFYPVMASETITFRKSLLPWMRFSIETRIIGYDAKAVYTEQRMVVDGEVYAVATMRSRFVKKSGGTATTAELGALLGVDVTSLTLPDWVSRWAADVALPTTREPAPSVWAD